MELRIATHGWRQVDGDVNPGSYGGTIALADGGSIELIKIMPLREYVSDDEAAEFGFPFWSKEAYFTLDDLDPNASDVRDARKFTDLTDEHLRELKPESRAMAVAIALLEYGRGDEGRSGWAKDVLGGRRVLWWGSKRPQGWRYLEDEDKEFRAFLRERAKESRR